jgi:hypothetical protein
MPSVAAALPAQLALRVRDGLLPSLVFPVLAVA